MLDKPATALSSSSSSYPRYESYTDLCGSDARRKHKQCIQAQPLPISYALLQDDCNNTPLLSESNEVTFSGACSHSQLHSPHCMLCSVFLRNWDVCVHHVDQFNLPSKEIGTAICCQLHCIKMAKPKQTVPTTAIPCQGLHNTRSSNTIPPAPHYIAAANQLFIPHCSSLIIQSCNSEAVFISNHITFTFMLSNSKPICR